MKRLLLALVACLATSAFAQPTPQHPRDAQREERAVQRERGYGRDHRYPRWCQGYDRRDYWRELRSCGRDNWRCRAQVRRKARICGMG